MFTGIESKSEDESKMAEREVKADSGTQGFLDRFFDCIPELSEGRNIFDVAAFAYRDMKGVLERHGLLEESFCARYLKRGGRKSNPNLEECGLPYSFEYWEENPKEIELIKSIKGILQRLSENHHKRDLEEYLKQFHILLKSIDMKKYLNEPELTDLVLNYVLICTIDYYAHCYKTRYEASAAYENELNEESADLFLIYRKSPDTKFSWDGKTHGIDNTDQKGINENLSEIFFVNTERIPEGVELSIQIYKPKEDKLHTIDRGDGTKVFRIAVVPFCKGPVTSFESGAGALFHVRYEDDYDLKYGKIAVDLLDAAIKNNCHIVVFPEYVISKGILDLLIKHLKEIHNSGNTSGNLLFVCAGTRWDESSNNIGTLIDANGTVLAEQYKSVPYRNKIDGIEYVEDLKKPGKRIDLLDFKGFGRVQFSICRDVCSTDINSNHSVIFNLFHPDLVLIPAWSGSLTRGFGAAFEYMGRLGAVSILGNCCESITFMLDQKKKEAEAKGTLFEANESASVRVFTGVPSSNAGRILKIACKHGKDDSCPVENCAIIYDLVLTNKNHRSRGSIFKIENHMMIQKNGTIENSNVLKNYKEASRST